jgi:hypothetical protein
MFRLPVSEKAGGIMITSPLAVRSILKSRLARQNFVELFNTHRCDSREIDPQWDAHALNEQRSHCFFSVGVGVK